MIAYKGLGNVLARENHNLVSFAVVIRVVTQRFSSTDAVSGKERLRDDANYGCEGD